MGWERLAAPYFDDAVRSELDDYFRNHGFKEVASHSPAVRFMRDVAFVEFAYISEAAPSYDLTPSIGLAPVDGTASRHIPIWTLAPPNEAEAWKFSDAKGLRSLLRHLVAEVLEDKVRPLWEDLEGLESRLEDFETGLRSSFIATEEAEILKRARRAFAAKRFDEALAGYALLGAEELSQVDRRRMAWARDHLPAQASDR